MTPHVHKAEAPRNVRTVVNGDRDAEPPEGIHTPGLGVLSRGRPIGHGRGDPHMRTAAVRR
ncbi:hypothetical protein ACWGQ5_27015 [Streptomyces sp. NPDC055722]